MKKLILASLVLLMSLFLFSCAEESVSMNEDYAGDWYLDIFFIQKYEFSDSTFVNKWYDDTDGFTNVAKGKITKLSDTEIELEITQMYDDDSQSWVSVGGYFDPETSTFARSSDGTELTLDGVVWSSVDPTK